MKRLQKRIKTMGPVNEAKLGLYHPARVPATPMTAPTARVTYAPNQSYPWGTLTYEDLHPMWAPDGALIPGVASSPAVTVHPAGR